MNRLTDAELEAMAGFTPGPWHVGAQNDLLYVIDRRPATSNDYPQHDAETAAITKVYCGNSSEANARLIAAAPAMYAELLERRAMDAVVREALEIARIHVAASAGASHMLEGFGPTRKTRDDLHLQMVDAALAPYREKTDAAE